MTNELGGSKTRRLELRVIRDIWDVIRAATPTHSHLRGRLVSAMVVTLIVDLAGSAAIFALERHAPSGAIATFWDALYWTTSQLTTISSTLPNPVTAWGEVVSIGIDIYAITVVSTLAGMFSAFFYRRGEERDPRNARSEPRDRDWDR